MPCQLKNSHHKRFSNLFLKIWKTQVFQNNPVLVLFHDFQTTNWSWISELGQAFETSGFTPRQVMAYSSFKTMQQSAQIPRS